MIKQLKQRKMTMLIVFVIIVAISLLMHPVAGLVTGIPGALAVEGIERYKTITPEGDYRPFDWWNVIAIALATVVAAALVAIGLAIAA
ncbi:MAG TPA: hypothetical protein GXZ87_07600 [Bacteroidales bacterium]|nr:hypothetical protein [Bacteroidales bacterium]